MFQKIFGWNGHKIITFEYRGYFYQDFIPSTLASQCKHKSIRIKSDGNALVLGL